MKNLVAKLFMTLVLLVGIPTLSLANTATNNETNTTDVGVYRLCAYCTHTHSVYLYKGSAEIGISGDGDTDLDLYVYDSYGKLVGKSAGYSDDEYISLNVYINGYFTVKVKNRGDVYNDYAFAVR